MTSWGLYRPKKFAETSNDDRPPTHLGTGPPLPTCRALHSVFEMRVADSGLSRQSVQHKRGAPKYFLDFSFVVAIVMVVCRTASGALAHEVSRQPARRRTVA
jgi:hypothetical protein